MNDLVNPAWVKEEIFSGGELMQMIPEERILGRICQYVRNIFIKIHKTN